MPEHQTEQDLNFYNLQELSELSSVPKQSLMRWIRAGMLEGYLTMYRSRKYQKCYRFRAGGPQETDEPVEGLKYAYFLNEEEDKQVFRLDYQELAEKLANRSTNRSAKQKSNEE